MDIDYDLLRKTVEARRDVGKWLTGRPYVGLSVLDVEMLVQGFDYLAEIIKDISGQNPVDMVSEQLEGPQMTITMGEDIDGKV